VSVQSASLRSALRSAGLSALVAALVYAVVLTLDAPGTPFGPGELDLLLGARLMAAGVVPPIWVGAVHPDALGTWLASAALAPLLRLGVPDVVALKLLAGGHYALLVGASAGLGTRLGGRRAGAVTAAILVLGAPSLLAAHSKSLATTVEAASLEVALLWAAIEIGHRRRIALLVPLGIAVGLTVAYSLHAAIALPLALAAALTRPGPRRLLAPGVVAAVAAAVLAPLHLWRDPLGPLLPPFSIKSQGLDQLLSLLDASDAALLVARWPFALLHGTEHLPVDAWTRWLHVPLALLLGGALVVAAVQLVRRAPPPEVAPVALFGVGATAPLLIAGDLIGYPAAYRYFVPALAAGAILLAVGLARGPLPDRQALGLLVALCLPGLFALPRATSTELSRPAAAFVAGQHRVTFARHPVHTHFLMLTPFVRRAELGGWVQGYGLHLGREFGNSRRLLLAERQTVRTGPGVGVPPRLDRLWLDAQPDRWLDAVGWLGDDVRERFLVGVGLGIGEDGRVDEDEALLLQILTGADAAATWGGIGAAMGERWHWLGESQPLDLTPPPPDDAAVASFAAGFRTTAGPGAPLPETLLASDGQRRAARAPYLVLPHPFTYAPPAPR